MSVKTIVVLLVLAAAAGGFFYYDSYWLMPAREKTEAAKGRLWTVEAKDVEAVTITRPGESIRLKRAEAADGTWSSPSRRAATVRSSTTSSPVSPPCVWIVRSTPIRPSLA